MSLLKIDQDADLYRHSARDAWSSFIATRFDTGPRTVGCSARAARVPQIKAELELMHEFLAITKQNVNAWSTGACNLPTEVLAIIFAFTQEVWPPRKIRTKHDLGWIRVTQVCSYWRKSALSTHTLWQKVDCIALPASMATDILTRSGRLPLQLYCDTELNTDVSNIISTWYSWPTLRRASLVYIEDCFDYQSDYDFELWDEVLRQSMPLLKDLSVIFAIENDPEALPADLLAGTQPALINLYLQNCLLPDWNTSILGDALTTLSLHMAWMYDEIAALPTMTELKSIFTRLTSLKRLYLKDFYPRKEPNPPNPFTFYPSLASFTFHVSLMSSLYESHYGAFWTLFNVPVTTSLKLWAYTEAEEYDEDVEGLTDPITRIENTTLPTKELVIDRLCLTLWCSERSSAMLVPPAQRLDVAHTDDIITRTITGPNSAARYYVHHLDLKPLCSVSTTQSAMKRLDRPKPDGGWLFKLGGARAVHRVSVYYTLCRSLLDDLLRRDANDKFSLFPLLDTIIFHHDSGVAETSGQTSLGLILLELLADRHEHGAPIRELFVDEGMVDWFIWSKIDKKKTRVTFFLSSLAQQRLKPYVLSI